MLWLQTFSLSTMKCWCLTHLTIFHRFNHVFNEHLYLALLLYLVLRDSTWIFLIEWPHLTSYRATHGWTGNFRVHIHSNTVLRMRINKAAIKVALSSLMGHYTQISTRYFRCQHNEHNSHHLPTNGSLREINLIQGKAMPKTLAINVHPWYLYLHAFKHFNLLFLIRQTFFCQFCYF